MSRIRALLGLVALGLCTCSGSSSLDMSSEPQRVESRKLGTEFVYGGRPVSPGNLEAVVGITKSGSATPLCTGVLIEPDIALTAAHCVCAGVHGAVFIGHDPGDKRPGVRRDFFKVSKRRLAMRCGESPRDRVDLALLKLRTGAKHITPVRLASDPLIDGAAVYRVVGFGATDREGKVFTFEKREADVVAVTNSCVANEAKTFGCKVGNEIVAGKRVGPDTCSGDSGGPLFASVAGSSADKSEDELYLAGITSRSVRGAKAACGDGGIYERVSPNVKEWIRESIVLLRENPAS